MEERTVSVQLSQVKGRQTRSQTQPAGPAQDHRLHIYAWSHSANKAATKRTRIQGFFELLLVICCLPAVYLHILSHYKTSSFTSRPWNRVQSPDGCRTVGFTGSASKWQIFDYLLFILNKLYRLGIVSCQPIVIGSETWKATVKYFSVAMAPWECESRVQREPRVQRNSTLNPQWCEN